MPYKLEQVSPRRWSVKNSETGTIHSKHTTKSKAEAQIRLLNSIHSLNGSGLIEQKYIDSMRDPSPNFPPKVPLPTIGNFEINVPPYVVKPIKRYGTGKFKNAYRTVGYKLVKTLTKTRNLSSREDGFPSINLIPETHETDATVESWGSVPTLDQFSKKDQAIIKKLFLKPNKPLYLTNKQRGFPEVLPKNIERHRELGTSQLPEDFVAPPPRKRGRPKKESVAELQAQAEAQAQEMGLGDEIDFGDDETPASTPRTPRTPKAKTPRTPTPRTPTPRPRGSPLPALRMPTNEEMGFDDDGNDLPTPRARTPTPKAPTPKEEAPVKKRGRPTKYGEDDEARNKSSKEQKKLSAQLIYRNSLSQEARDKYDAKQAKKAGKSAPAPAPAPAPPTPRPKTPQPPTPQPSISPVSSASSSSSSLSKEDKKAEKKADKKAEKKEKKKAEKLEDKIREKATKKVDDKFPDLSPSERDKKIKKLTDEYKKQREETSGKGIQQGGSLKIKSKHNNMDSRNMLSHNLPQAETQIRASLGIMRGSGVLDDIGNAFKSIPRKAAKALKLPTSVNDLKGLVNIAQIPTDVAGVKRYGKTALTYGLPAASSAVLGGLAGAASLGNPLAAAAGGTMGGIAGRAGAEQINRQIGNGILGDLLDRPFTARQAIKRAKSVPALARDAVAEIRGVGVLGDLLDKPFTARQAIKRVKSVPALAREAASEIRGVGVKPAKGSQAMKDKMARLRAMRRK